MIWKGGSDFFNRGKEKFPEQSGKETLVSWRFSKYSDLIFPFHFFECSMNAWGLESRGFGASRTHLQAVSSAFGEAWERLWLKKLSVENPGSRFSSSNGFAAGISEIMALNNSRNELIERAVLIEAWSSQKAWLPAKIKSPRNRLMAVGLRLKGWRVSLFNLNSNLGRVKACLLRHEKLGSIFDTCYEIDDAMAEEKLLVSVIKCSYFHESRVSYELPKWGRPEDHARFYSVPSNNAAFDFLENSDFSKSKIEIENGSHIKSVLHVEVGSFPAVAQSTNENWTSLCWGTNSIKGKNPWPHPLA